MASFERQFPIELDGAAVELVSVDRNSSTARLRLVVRDNQGDVVSELEKDVRLWQADFLDPEAMHTRVMENASRLDLSSTSPEELFATYPVFKPLKRRLSTEKIMSTIRNSAENGVGGFNGAASVTRWWPQEARTVLFLSRMFEQFRYSTLRNYVEDNEPDDWEATRAALSAAGCVRFLAALDAVLGGGDPSDEFMLPAVLEEEVRPALEAYIEKHAAVLRA